MLIINFIQTYNQSVPIPAQQKPAKMDSQCSVCHKKNDQLLMLSCGHDPCIDCAASHYFTGAEFRKQFQLVRQANYWCQICYQPTIIDKSSIDELNHYYNSRNNNSKGTTQITQSLKRSKSLRTRQFSKNQSGANNPYHIIGYPKQKNKGNRRKQQKQRSKQLDNLMEMVRSHQLKSTNIIGKSQYSNQIRSSIKNAKSAKQLIQVPIVQAYMRYVCPAHQDQLQNYYCFTCIRSICVQCALHGSHVGHQVQAVKKASAKLKFMYEILINQSQKLRTVLQNNIKEVDRLIDSFKSWNSQHSNLIKQKFSQLYEMLAHKQKIILDEIKQNQMEGLKRLKAQKTNQQQILQGIKNSRRQLKKNINLQPSYWNISEMQKIKNQLKQYCESKQLKISSNKKIDSQMKYVQTQLISQAIDTIEELVSSFKISYHKNQNSTLSKS